MGGMILTEEKQHTRSGFCPSATLSIRNPPLTDPVLKHDLHDEWPSTIRLSHGTTIPAFSITKILGDLLTLRNLSFRSN
jgi:hypothetical protein